MTQRTAALLLLAAAAVLYFASLGSLPLLEPDEGRYAEIPREMAASGDWVTPRLNGVAYLEKPPLLYWGNALSMTLLGEGELAARAFSALCAVALAGVTLWVATTLAGPAAGLVSGAFAAASPYVFAIGRTNTVDNPLAPSMAAATFAVWLYMSGRTERKAVLWGGYAAAALAFLSKGLVGVVFPGAILVLWALLARRPRTILRALSPVGIALFLALSLPWIVLCQRANPDFLWFFFVREHFLRYSTTVHQRFQPFWYFLPVVAGALLPWLPFLAGRAPREGGGAPGGEGGIDREGRLLLWCWLLFVLLFFSASKSKLPTYMLPLVPPLCVLAGERAARWALAGAAEGRDGAWRDRLPALLAPVVALLLAAALVLAPRFSREAVDPAAWRAAAAAPLACALLYGAFPLLSGRIGRGRALAGSVLSFALLLPLLTPALSLLLSSRSSRDAARVVSSLAAPGDAVAVSGDFRHSLPFYLKRPVLYSGKAGELEYGIERDPRRDEWYLSPGALEALWRSDRRLFVLLSGRRPEEGLGRFPGGRLLWRSRKGILVVNR